jgi:pimeloyl-ACP methyl ester carboxylesterase/putative NADH-flavin reductase
MASINPPQVHHRTVDVDGVRVFYREVGAGDGPVILLLHGFPSGSHQFRRLFDAMASGYRLVAADYPGFGHTEAPTGYRYTFDALADTMEAFVHALDLAPFVAYMFDFGGPVGMRLAVRHPEWISGIIVQNANMFDEGLTELAKDMIANRPGVTGAEERVREILELPATRAQYLDGATDASLIAPEGWLLDQYFLDRPGRKDAQVSLALDYGSNVSRYAEWQAWLDRVQPPTLVLWGRHDPFFGPGGANAFSTCVPDAEVHLLDTGHFALEESLPQVTPLIDAFLARTHGQSTALQIAVVGASGQLGSEVAQEAAARGHTVAQLRSADADATVPATWSTDLSRYDTVVLAVKGPDGTVERAVTAALQGLPAANPPHLVVVGGGASLKTPDGSPFIELPSFPQEYLETASDQAAALSVLRGADSTIPWTYVSPPPKDLVPGPKTGGHHVEARDTPLVDADGAGHATFGDLAAAVVDISERRRFLHRRVTVASLQ